MLNERVIGNWSTRSEKRKSRAENRVSIAFLVVLFNSLVMPSITWRYKSIVMHLITLQKTQSKQTKKKYFPFLKYSSNLTILQINIYILYEILVAAYCYGMVSYNASHALRLLSVLMCIPIWVLNNSDSSTEALCQIPAETPSSEAGRNLGRNVSYFAGEVSLSYSVGVFNMP
jgi:hypothetical protein